MGVGCSALFKDLFRKPMHIWFEAYQRGSFFTQRYCTKWVNLIIVRHTCYISSIFSVLTRLGVGGIFYPGASNWLVTERLTAAVRFIYYHSHLFSYIHGAAEMDLLLTFVLGTPTDILVSSSWFE